MTTSLIENAIALKNPKPLRYPEPDNVMKTRGRSFYFASRFLNPSTSERASRLYQFCRAIDDIADRSSSKELARDQLELTIAELNGLLPPSKHTESFLRLANDTNLDLRAAIELVKGCRSDLCEHVVIEDEESLIRYCYQVAGSVGIMMCSLLGVNDPRAFPHAVDLGIAMQITNITRDIAEDARSGRRYLPTTLVGNLSCSEILSPSNKALNTISVAVESMVRLADRYYKSGKAGYCFLPSTSRPAIAIAASIYRQIGVRVHRNPAGSLARRVVVSRWEKLILAALSGSRELLFYKPFPSYVHNSALHKYIRNYPGTNPLA
tara:strand:- start:930 stop:1895 length:966 start_codon:yes stop_codon:yes gene_type:complete